ncbi:MAG: helix-turn-helix domain-containing protein [Deltaproteobacteria bacterium]|nr:helix-turn-helix domain-containing protein [Deltaproteobacteria bacterium]
MVKVEMESFGAYLRKEREARKASLEEICRATKIRRTILEAIEEDQREVLPPEVFVKGFIEAYARYIGLDPEEVLFRYKEWQKEYPTKGTEEPFLEREKEVPKKYIVAGAILLMIIIVLFLLLIGQGPRERVEEASIKGTYTEQEVTSPPGNLQAPSLTPSAEESTPLPKGGAQEKEEALPGREHVLVIEASERTWVEIKEGSSPPFDVTLSPGDRYTRRGPHCFELLIGNAGGVKVIFDGREFGLLGEVGQVVKLTLPPGKEG